MDTTKNEQLKNQRPAPSKMLFLEKAQWKKDDEIITVFVDSEIGERIEVGHIFLHGYDDNKKPQFACVDAKGNKIFDLTNNLYELKRDFKDKEAELTKTAEGKELSSEESEPESEDEKEEPEMPLAKKEGEVREIRNRTTGKQKNQTQER